MAITVGTVSTDFADDETTVSGSSVTIGSGDSLLVGVVYSIQDGGIITSSGSRTEPTFTLDPGGGDEVVVSSADGSFYGPEAFDESSHCFMYRIPNGDLPSAGTYDWELDWVVNMDSYSTAEVAVVVIPLSGSDDSASLTFLTDFENSVATLDPVSTQHNVTDGDFVFGVMGSASNAARSVTWSSDNGSVVEHVDRGAGGTTGRAQMYAASVLATADDSAFTFTATPDGIMYIRALLTVAVPPSTAGGGSIDAAFISSTESLFTPSVVQPAAPTKDIKVQRGKSIVSADGETATLTDSVSSLDNAFVVLTTNRLTGSSNSTGNAEADDLSVQARLTDVDTITFDRPDVTPGVSQYVAWEVWEYVGPASGDNEFIVRSRNEVTENGVVNTATLDSTPTSIDRCIPFVNGMMSSDINNGGNGLAVVAWLSDTDELSVQWSEDDAIVKSAHVTTVEFTGSNWSVGHGRVDGSTADSGTIDLVEEADGLSSGTTFSVSDWSEALIASWGHAGDGSNEALADNWPVFEPGSSDSEVDFSFHPDHDGSDDDLVVHVLNHTDMSVTRVTSTSSLEGITNVSVSGAGLSDLDHSSVMVTATSSGGGTAYARGWRSVFLSSLTNVELHCGRSGNTINANIQVTDLTGITSSGGGGGQAIESAFLSSTSQLFTPTFAQSAQERVLGFLGSSASLLTPSLSQGAQERVLGFVAASSQTFTPDLAQGAQERTLSLISASSQLFTPALSQGAQERTLGFISATSQALTPTLSQGAQERILGFISGSSALFPPSLAAAGSLVLSFIPSGSEVFTPSLQGSAVSELPFISSLSELFTPHVRVGTAVELPTIPSGETLFTPVLGQSAQERTLGFISSGESLLTPDLETQQAQSRVLGFVTSSNQLLTPTLLQDQQLFLQTIESESETFTPFLINTILPTLIGVIGPTGRIYTPQLANEFLPPPQPTPERSVASVTNAHAEWMTGRRRRR